MTAFPIPSLLMQEALSPFTDPQVAGISTGQEDGDSSGAATQWESVWREAAPIENSKGRQQEGAPAAGGVQKTQAEEAGDGLKTALAALFMPLMPAPAEKPLLHTQCRETPDCQSEPAAPGGIGHRNEQAKNADDNSWNFDAAAGEILRSNAKAMPVPPPSTTDLEPAAQAAGAQKPDAEPTLTEPLPTPRLATPFESAEPTPPGGAQHSGPISVEARLDHPAEPVASVLLRPAVRQSGAENRGNAATAVIDGAPITGFRAASEPLGMPRPADDRIAAWRGAMGEPEHSAERPNGLAGGNTSAAALHFSENETTISEQEPHAPGKDVAAHPAQAQSVEPEQNGAVEPGGPGGEQERPSKQNTPQEGAQQLDTVHGGGSSGQSLATADAGKLRSTTDPASRAGLPPGAPADPEPAQDPARLNGQLDLQVDGRGGERVRIRFAEAPGGIRMRMASNDARLAESLRAEWQSLEAALRRSGWDPQPVAGEPAEAVGETLGGIQSQSGEPGGSADAGDRRASPAAAEHGQRQQTQQGGSRQEGRHEEQHQARQEWLDLSALRRLGRRRQA